MYDMEGEDHRRATPESASDQHTRVGQRGPHGTYAFPIYAFPMRLQCFSYAFPKLPLRCPDAFPMLCLCFPYAFPHAFPMLFQCSSYASRMFTLCLAYVSPCIPYALASIPSAFPMLSLENH